ncbi:MAG: hypothetical protein ACI89D_000269 [Bermanella sp.]|jgi:uncharacterized protein YaeQ
MALKPTIYKLKLMLSDMDRNIYETLNITLAQHPSETLERMMVRVLAYCINLEEHLDFAKGLSVTDEPDIWLRTLDDRIKLWIDVGEPGVDRIKKASRISEGVRIYSFNSKSSVWWKQEGSKLNALKAEVFQVDWEGAQRLAAMVERTMDFSLTLSEGSAYFAADNNDCELSWIALNA